MNIHLKCLLAGSLLLLAAFSVMAEEISCELKKDGHSKASEKTGNEFTFDKTWRFKSDDLHPKETVNSNESPGDNSPEQNTAEISNS